MRTVSLILAAALVVGVVAFVLHDERRLFSNVQRANQSAHIPVKVRPGDPPGPGPARRVSDTIYRCDNGGQVVFSDTPCGNVVERIPVVR